MSEYKGSVGDRGEVTIPKELRDRHGIEPGDEVLFTDADSEGLLKLLVDEDRLGEGYRKRAERSRELAEEMEEASSEANDCIGDSPDWCE